MNAIEKIIEEMNSQAAAENAAYEAAEKKQIDEKFATDANEQQAVFEKQKAKQLTAVDSKYRQLKNRQQVEIRQQSLQEKQDFLASLFQRAAEEMAEWPATEAQSFAEKALQNLPVTGAVKLLAGEQSPYYSAEWLATVNNHLDYQLELSDEKVPKQAGFIVDDQGVQYNFIFENLIKDLQGELAFEIADQLFN